MEEQTLLGWCQTQLSQNKSLHSLETQSDGSWIFPLAEDRSTYLPVGLLFCEVYYMLDDQIQDTGERLHQMLWTLNFWPQCQGLCVRAGSRSPHGKNTVHTKQPGIS